VGIPVELAYQKGADETRYPFIVKIGWIYSDAPHPDPYFNSKGQSLGLVGGAPQLKNTRNALYVSADKTVWRSQVYPSSLTIFGNETQELELSEIYRATTGGGVVWTGPFPSRPIDRLAFEAFDIQLTPHEVEFLRDSRIKAGGRGLNRADEYELESTYSYAFLPGLRVMPSVQYIINPDNSLLPRTRSVPKNATVFGIQFIANLTSILGVPSLVAQ
jgi:porin